MVHSPRVSVVDGEERGGSRSGARRRRTRPRSVSEDDRPRGYQPQRMQRLWNDIDHARDKLGLGRDADAAGAGWGMAGLLGCAGEIVMSVQGMLSVVAWGVTGMVTSALVNGGVRRNPGIASALQAAVDVAPWLRDVPIVGSVLTVMRVNGTRSSSL